MPLTKFVVAGRHQAERLESAAVADEIRAGLPVRSLRLIHAEIRGPLRHGLVEHGRQPIDLRAARHIGVQNEVLAGELANAVRLELRRRQSAGQS